MYFFEIAGLDGLHDPLRIVELADDTDVDERCLAGNDGFDGVTGTGLHRVTLQLRLPGRERKQHGRIIEPAMKSRAVGSRGLLDDLAGADPGVRLLLRCVSRFDVNFEDVNHSRLSS